MSYYLYYCHFKKNFPQEFALNRTRAILLIIQGLISALAWLLAGPIIIYLLVYPSLSGNFYLYWLSILAIMIYGPLQSLFITSNFKKLSLATKTKIISINRLDQLYLALFSIPVSIIHSLPPYYSIFIQVKHSIFHQKIVKPKTNE